MGGGVIATDYHGYCGYVKIEGIVVGQQLSELEHKLLDMSINLTIITLVIVRKNVANSKCLLHNLTLFIYVHMGSDSQQVKQRNGFNRQDCTDRVYRQGNKTKCSK